MSVCVTKQEGPAWTCPVEAQAPFPQLQRKGTHDSACYRMLAVAAQATACLHHCDHSPTRSPYSPMFLA